MVESGSDHIEAPHWPRQAPTLTTTKGAAEKGGVGRGEVWRRWVGTTVTVLLALAWNVVGRRKGQHCAALAAIMSGDGDR